MVNKDDEEAFIFMIKYNRKKKKLVIPNGLGNFENKEYNAGYQDGYADGYAAAQNNKEGQTGE